MTKKNLKPQQAAPVQREINTTASHGTGLMMTPHSDGWRLVPFAGDDAEQSHYLARDIWLITDVTQNPDAEALDDSMTR